MRYFIVCLLIFSISSCEQNSGLSDKELDLELEKNKQNFVFMSFYPNMPDKVEKALIKRELKKGKITDVSSKYTDGKDIIYTLKYNNKERDFNLYISKYKVSLSSYESQILSSALARKEFEQNHIYTVMDILNLYENKYEFAYSAYGDKSYKELGSRLWLSDLPYYVKDSIVLKNNSNVVILKGSLFRDFKGNKWRSDISLRHYTKKSFSGYLNELNNDRLNDSLYNVKLRMKRIEKMYEENDATLKDLN